MSVAEIPTLPALLELEGALSRALDRRVTVVHRAGNPFGSTFRTEVVSWRGADGSTGAVFCKYGEEGKYGREGHAVESGQRGGVEREALVYSTLLERLDLTTARLIGTHVGKRGDTWLFLELLQAAVRVGRASDPDALVNAARWLARFHRSAEQLLSARPLGLPSYDGPYYDGCFARALTYSARWQTRFPWLHTMAARRHHLVAALLTAPRTVIHGEFYPNNVLYREGDVYPVDWESAAVAPGEIDLVTLTERWPARDVSAARTAYSEARWPDGPPALHQQTLLAGQAYVQLRWLGDRTERSEESASSWRYEVLEGTAVALGLLER
jgi:hypothetical protein